MGTRLTLRCATAADQAAIVRLVHSERLNPSALRWLNFIVAERDGEVIGAVQMRHHADGSRELGSLWGSSSVA
jgi:amino-acid N-acetyltransferase